MTANADLRSRADGLSRQPAHLHDADRMTAIVSEIVGSLSGNLTVGDIQLYSELEGLARVIQSAKAEIASVRPDQISERDIPLATDELDAVVGATEDATGAILDACESLEGLAPTLSGEAGEAITSAVTRIYEACNFQDITGQRITKVVKTLKHIEARVDALLQAFGDGVPATAPPPSPPQPAPTPVATDDKLLNGPQLPDDAKRQSDIDAILASFD